MVTKDDSVVYWIYDTSCIDPYQYGYVGMTNDFKRRKKEHIRTNKFPDCEYRILFEGTRIECYALEKAFRPEKGIGWNSSPGGEGGRMLGYKHPNPTNTFKAGNTIWLGRKHTEETKNLIGNKNRNRKRPDLSARNRIDNPMKNPDTVEKSRKSNIGQPPWNKGIPHSESTKRKIGYLASERARKRKEALNGQG